MKVPLVQVRARVVDKYVSLALLAALVALSVCMPLLAERVPGPDAWTLWNSYSRSANCNIWNPFAADRSSYECTALILDTVGVDLGNAWIYGLFCNLMLTALPLAFFRRISLSLVVLLCAWGVVRGFFLENLTKELLVGAVVILLMLSIKLARTRLPMFLPAFLYGVMVRPYWVLIASGWAALCYAKDKLPPRVIALAIPVVFLGVAAALEFWSGQTISSFRAASNEFRVIGEVGSRSLIVPALSGSDIVSQALDALLTLVRLAAPVELLLLSGFHQAPFVLLMIATVVVLARRYARAESMRARDALAFPISFLVVQALFEPDFGSAARHFSLVAPVAFCGFGLSQTVVGRVGRK